MEKTEFIYQRWYLRLFLAAFIVPLELAIQTWFAEWMGIEYADFGYVLVCILKKGFIGLKMEPYIFKKGRRSMRFKMLLGQEERRFPFGDSPNRECLSFNFLKRRSFCFQLL